MLRNSFLSGIIDDNDHDGGSHGVRDDVRVGGTRDARDENRGARDGMRGWVRDTRGTPGVDGERVDVGYGRIACSNPRRDSNNDGRIPSGAVRGRSTRRSYSACVTNRVDAPTRFHPRRVR